jgi:hypothetical protein
VAWEEAQSAALQDIAGVLTTPQRTPSGSSFFVAASATVESVPAAAFADDYYVTWVDRTTTTSYSAYVARVSTAGALLDPGPRTENASIAAAAGDGAGGWLAVYQHSSAATGGIARTFARTVHYPGAQGSP